MIYNSGKKQNVTIERFIRISCHQMSTSSSSIIEFLAWTPFDALPQVEKLITNNMDPDQTARRRMLVWIHAGRKPTMLVLS
jgi:hypothetical protein